MKNTPFSPCHLQHRLQEAVQKAVLKSIGISLIPEISRSKPPQDSDYQTAVAMGLAKENEEKSQRGRADGIGGH